MKIAECDNTQADFIAWFKYKISFEEKAVRLVAVGIVACALVSLVGNLAGNWAAVLFSVIAVAIIAGVWCLYNKTRLNKEMMQFVREKKGKKAVVSFSNHGMHLETEGKKAYYSFKKIRKAREIPWYLFLFLEDDSEPIIIDKKKIRTATEDMEPYYIAKKLREQSPDYRYIRGNDLTYTGKYSKLVHR